MKNAIKNISKKAVAVAGGVAVTGAFVWVILLASNFNGF